MTELEQLEIVRECCRHAEIYNHEDFDVETCNHINNAEGYCSHEDCPILHVDTKQFSIDVDKIKEEWKNPFL